MNACYAAGWRAAVLLALASHVAAQEPQPRDFEGWPTGWVTAYRRFEAYIAARRASWPSAHLEISEQGRITHAVRLEESHSEHLTLRFFRRGRQVLAMGMADELMAQGREQTLTAGSYTACLWASGAIGYQHIYPFIDFEIVDAGKSKSPGSPSAAAIRMVASPAEAESVWPNERLFLFLDFHIFPCGFPSDIAEANRKLQPSVSLRLDNHGRIDRDKLDAGTERLLRWRAYFDGKLIDNASAADATRYEPHRGFGTYQALLGVEGPGGLMPVSNLIEFPLFPGPNGTGAVVPADGDGDGIPDFLEAILARTPAALAPANPDRDTDNDGVPDREEERNPGMRATLPRDELDRRLLELWESWAYDLKHHPPTRAAARR